MTNFALGAATVEVRARLDDFRRDLGRARQETQAAVADMGGRFGAIRKDVSAVGDELGLRFPTRAALAAGAVLAVGAAIMKTAQAGEQIRVLEGRFTALTGSATRAEALVRGVFEAARETGAGVDAVGDLAAGFRLALDAVGASDAEVLTFTENLIKLGTVGGANVEQIANGTRQLSQGLAGGVLRAEEFNSVVENTPMIAKALADELAGGSLGALRQMVLEGKVLSDDVFRAILDQTDEIGVKFDALPMTIERAANSLSTTVTQLLAGLDEALGISELIAQALMVVPNAVEALKAWSEQGVPESMRGKTDAEIVFGTPPAPPAQPRAPAAAGGGGSSRPKKSPEQEYSDDAERILEGATERVQRMEEERQLIGLKGEALERLRASYDAARIAQDLKTAADKAGVEVSASHLEQLAQLEQWMVEVALSTEEARMAQDALREAQEEAQASAERQARALEAIGNAFTQGVTSADSFADALRNIAVNLANLLAQAAVGAGPLGELFNSLLGVASGGLVGYFGSAPTANAPISAPLPPPRPFAKGAVLRQPATFLSGGTYGVMAEAGEEAIMPLRRGPDGALGVLATGGGRGGKVEIAVSLSPDLEARVTRNAAGAAVSLSRPVARGEFADRVRRDAR